MRQAQVPLAAGNDPGARVSLQDVTGASGAQGFLPGHDLKHLESTAATWHRQEGVGARPGRHGAHLPRNVDSAERPIDKAVFFRQARGISDPIARLRHCRQTAPNHVPDAGHECGCRELGKPDLELTGGLRSGYLRRHGPVNRAGIEPRVHAHEADPRGPVSSQDRRTHRRRTAVARQEAGMNVEAAGDWEGQQGGFQDLAEGSDHHQVGLAGTQTSQERIIIHGDHTVSGATQRVGVGPYRCRLGPAVPPARSIGLSANAKQADTPIRKQCVKQRHAKTARCEVIDRNRFRTRHRQAPRDCRQRGCRDSTGTGYYSLARSALKGPSSACG